MDRGFLYGDGVFETMRAECGHILDLDRHLDRLHGSLAVLRIRVEGLVDWETVLSGLLTRNDLLRTPASVKIVVTRGISSAMGLPTSVKPTIFLLSQRFEPPTDAAYHKGWGLVVHQSGFSPPLAGHKTLNYLYFLAARQGALNQGANEAIVLDPSGGITETAAGSLLVRSNGAWWTPASPFQLPSVTLCRLLELLAKGGQFVERRKATPADLENAETVWVVSSLVLIMPVSHISGRPLPDLAVAEADHWRRALLAST
jgi:branched-chain amino acid aminotransferase/para-aminobenzoate synthetase component 1